MSKGSRSKRNVANHVSNMMARGGQAPNEQQLAEAVDILNAGKKIVIMAGRGALGAGDALTDVAERLKAPIVKPLLGKGAVADDNPYCIGGTGLLGTRPAQEALEQCDTLLIAGSSFPYIEFYPQPGKAKAVQIELDPMRVGLRYPVDAALSATSARCWRR